MTTTPSAHPASARLRLGAEPRQGGSARRIDGAWWPSSYDLVAELPALLAALPRRWGHITSVLVNGTMWSVPGDGMLVGDQMVHIRRTDTPRAEHTVCLLAPGHGRWDLLVVPPAATEAEAERLTSAAATAGDLRTAGWPMADVEATGDVTEVRSREEVWETDGGAPRHHRHGSGTERGG
ncbi:DUF5994 family protein [Streptomyces sp. NRRL S-455]|uniref:DUF5994 family protein n=1 Tax=Streptomyces sp. NRRL S-455 TaxID=1463908 RepID=UPI000A7F4E70|nr:DUF5994 family protein [Streptomyces sp. NRRL S-455]